MMLGATATTPPIAATSAVLEEAIVGSSALIKSRSIHKIRAAKAEDTARMKTSGLHNSARSKLGWGQHFQYGVRHIADNMTKEVTAKGTASTAIALEDVIEREISYPRGPVEVEQIQSGFLISTGGQQFQMRMYPGIRTQGCGQFPEYSVAMSTIFLQSWHVPASPIGAVSVIGFPLT
jgi:hypothetical protein